jgi:predicted methyltransferase
MFNGIVMWIWNMCIHYINVELLTVPSQHYGSCTYHVSGSVLCFLSGYKYTTNTRAKTNKITLQQFTANQSTCRHLHYFTLKDTFRHGASGSTVTVTKDKTVCVLAKLIASTGNVRIISRKIEILCQDKESVSDSVILLEMAWPYCMMSTLLVI